MLQDVVQEALAQDNSTSLSPLDDPANLASKLG